jgi:hypothetical protein
MKRAAEIVRPHGIEYFATQKGSYTTECPNCSGGYLNVKIDKDGVAWYCHHCEQGGGEKFDQTEASERGPSKACYDYVDEQGQLLFQVLRFEPLHGPKQFRQRKSPDQKKWSIKGVRLVPFHLPQLIAAIGRGETVFVVEGEKDVLTLEKAGIVAACNPMSAGKWRAAYNEIFAGADVVVISERERLRARCTASPSRCA